MFPWSLAVTSPVRRRVFLLQIYREEVWGRVVKFARGCHSNDTGVMDEKCEDFATEVCTTNEETKDTKVS